ncbi:MAG TPA: VOC family protein [Thermoleophilaceae bacterium]|jgi:catechol 2,3-dioxygenase-like lactoylglutathione lyase family enzyme|nr:VOC family protein [Thermoleophilaceae bacterium]
MNVSFVSSIGVVASDAAANRKLYIDAIGLPLRPATDGSDYYLSEDVGGVKHFGVWPLAEAAQACFGTREWPANLTVPQASIEFEVESVDAVSSAGGELESAGFELLHPAREEPWGQTVTRVLSPDGMIVGISYAPSQH